MAGDRRNRITPDRDEDKDLAANAGLAFMTAESWRMGEHLKAMEK